ncbi:hypothetical protein CH267_13340 [Rhodococcus sp. 06-621-2]|nr:hypothetical protein CH267_13340 [Rhodococcus sp. 06-621-2]
MLYCGRGRPPEGGKHVGSGRLGQHGSIAFYFVGDTAGAEADRSSVRVAIPAVDRLAGDVGAVDH